MRSRTIFLTAILASSALGRSAAAAPPEATVSVPAPKPPRKHIFGVTLEVGAPDLLGVRLTVRPLPWLRVGLGPVVDLISAGIGAGVTWVPLKYIVSPSLTCDGGFLFPADVHGLANSFGLPITSGKVGYGYVNGHIGLEIGARRRVNFYLHAGISYVNFLISDVASKDTSFSSGHLTLFGPSAKLGLTVFI